MRSRCQWIYGHARRAFDPEIRHVTAFLHAFPRQTSKSRLRLGCGQQRVKLSEAPAQVAKIWSHQSQCRRLCSEFPLRTSARHVCQISTRFRAKLECSKWTFWVNIGIATWLCQNLLTQMLSLILPNSKSRLRLGCNQQRMKLSEAAAQVAKIWSPQSQCRRLRS